MKSTDNPNPTDNTKHTRHTRRTALAIAALLAIFIGNTPTARAANITWSGSNSTTWTDGANWVGGTAPDNSLTTDTAVFDSATYTNQPNSTTARSIAGITIGANSGAVTINTLTTGNRLAIGSGGITMESGAGSLTVGVETLDGVLVNANQTWTNDSASALGWNSMSTTGNLGAVTLTLSGTGSGGFSQLQNTISQGTNTTLAIVVDYSGAGTVSMIRATNTYSGGLTIKQGTVLVNQNNGTGAGTVTLGVNGGTANATLTSANVGSTRSYASAFVLATGHTGNLTIASTGAPTGTTSYGATFTGGVTGTNNLIVDATSSNANQNSIQFTTSGLNFTGNLTKTGDKTAALGAANTFNGIALVEAGTLRLDHVNALQNATLDTGTSGAQAVTFNLVGANTYNLGGLQGADALAIGNNTISVGANNASTTFSAVISGTGGNLTKVGSGTLTLSGNNTYTGATTVDAGTLQIGAGGTSGSISSTSGITNNGTLAIDRSDALTVSTIISGTGALTKNGAGTLALTGNNTYTGATTVNAGTLQAAVTGALGNSTVINVTGGSFLVTAANAVNDNAAVNLGGGRMALSGNFDETVGLLTLSANSTIDFSGFGGTLRFGGIDSWESGATLAIWNWSGTTRYGTQINNYGTPSNLVFTNNSTLTSNLANIIFYSDSGNSIIASGFEVSGFSGGGTEIIPVPEAETYIAAALLLAGYGIFHLRRRAKRKSLQNHHPEFATLAPAHQRDRFAREATSANPVR
jgi:fibronectin-binding autotransporter adhesin